MHLLGQFFFTDSDGVDHISDGRTSNATDRSFFIDGMNGGIGTDIIFDPHLFNETMACFYAPIHYDGEIIGVLRGAYLAEEYLHDMLNTSYFGEQAGLFLCTPDGTVIASSDDNEKTYEGNLIDILLETNVINEEAAAGAREIFANGGEGAYLCDVRLNSKVQNALEVMAIRYCLSFRFKREWTSLIRYPSS